MNKARTGLATLLLDGRIVSNVAGKYTVQDRGKRPVVRLTDAQAKPILSICKKVKSKGFVFWSLERKYFSKMHGNDWRYKQYREHLKDRRKANQCIQTKFSIISSPYKKGLCTKLDQHSKQLEP